MMVGRVKKPGWSCFAATAPRASRPALLARADRGYARFLAHTTQAAPGDSPGDRDDAVRHR